MNKQSLAEQLEGTPMGYHDRASSLGLQVVKALDITGRTDGSNPYEGPVLLCYGEDSRGVFVEMRHAWPEGDGGASYQYPVEMLRTDEEVRLRFEHEVTADAREGFADFVIENAPLPTGKAVGVTLPESVIHLI